MRQPKGLIVTVEGRRMNRVTVLEEQVALLSAELRVLLKTNTVLRAKEAVQLQLLHSYECNLQYLGPIIMQTTDTQQQTSVLAAAVVMDVKAQELLKELRSNSISPAPMCSDPDMENSHESGGTTSISRSPGIVLRSPTEQLSRTQRLWASVTHDAVRAMEGISTRDLAERFKHCIMRLALVNRCKTNLAGLPDGVESALDAMGLLTMVAQVAATEQVLEVQCLNLETMQPTVVSDNWWVAVVQQLRLTAEQRHKVVLAFECYKAQRASLLQQQGQLVEQLRSLLESKPPEQHQDNSSGSDMDVALLTRCFPGGSSNSAGAGGRSAGGRSGLKSSSNSTGSMGLALMDLEAAMQAEAVLAKLERNIKLQRAASRQLTYFWIDLLTTKQHADAILGAYPHNIKIPAVLSCIWQHEITLQESSAGRRACSNRE